MSRPKKINITAAQLSKFNKAKLVWVFAITRDPSIKATIFRIVNLIADDFNACYSGACFAMLNDIANAAGVERRTVQRAIKMLIDAGYLIRQCKNGHGNPNRYYMSNKVNDWASILGLDGQPENIVHDTTKKKNSDQCDVSPMSHQIIAEVQSDVTNLTLAYKGVTLTKGEEEDSSPIFDESISSRLGVDPDLIKSPPKSAQFDSLGSSLGKKEVLPLSQAPIKSSKHSVERFEEFFDLFLYQYGDLKMGKFEKDKFFAKSEYEKLIKREEISEHDLLLKTAAYILTLNVRNSSKFCMKPMNWLRGGKWKENPQNYVKDNTVPKRKSRRASAIDSIAGQRAETTRTNNPIIEGTCHEQ